ncbi:MAG: LegC family aminotransferase [Lachnospiraceae bacterium]|nr:LegC family aminotransferase [Lachnospiraceae bacterium]
MSTFDRCIPLSVPNFEGNEKKYVDDAVEQTWVSTGGAYIVKMEEQLKNFLGTERVACVQSGTAALHLSLIESGVESGDVVLVPPLTFIAAVNPVRYLGAEPVFIDCDDSFCMDPQKLRKFCEEECTFINGKLNYCGKRVKTVVVVHVFGNMADMEGIMDVAQDFNLTVVEDATEALGTKYISGRYAGKYAGTIGNFGAYSFNGNKIITTGGGGAITARKASDVDHIKYLSTQAKDDPHYYIHNEIGYNYRMTNLQAALGVAQMEELPGFIEKKHLNYNLYCELFDGFKLAYIMPFRKGIYSNQWFYSLCIDRNKIKASMRDIVTDFEKHGVGSRPIWGLINEQKPYQGYHTFNLEKAPYYADRIINIPCSTGLKKDDVEYAAKVIKEELEKLK